MKNCILCDNSNSKEWKKIFNYDQPDKYEKWMGLTGVSRSWVQCNVCGHYQQERNYDLSYLEKIYLDGYRDEGFRGENVFDAYSRISSLPFHENENLNRTEWLVSQIKTKPKTLLDIGSGLGVFPVEMWKAGINVHCVDANHDSIKLIRSFGIDCTHKIPSAKRFDLVSLVHLLEHLEDPKTFLKNIKANLNYEGRLFIEVPDSNGFLTQKKDHDDFNSCHCCMYGVTSLSMLLEQAGYKVLDIHRQHYTKRKLNRIMAICS